VKSSLSAPQRRSARRCLSLALLLLSCDLAAQARNWTGRPVTELLSVLQRSGIEVLYSSELVPARWTIGAEPPSGGLLAQANSVLAVRGLELQQLSPGRYVVSRQAAPARTAAVPAGAAAAGGSLERLPEVAIYSSRYAFDRHGFAVPSALSRHNLAQAPGARSDVLRAAQTLPGITTGTSSRPYIRGSVPEDVLVLFDGVAIADPFHLQRFQRLISVFDSSVVDRMDVYSGGYPVRYGTRSGGVIALTPRTLARGHEHGVDVGLQNVALSTVGHADHSQLNWLFALRGNLIDLQRKPAGSGVRQSNLLDFIGRARWQQSAASAWVIGSVLMDDRIRLHNRAGDESATSNSRDERSWLAFEHQGDSPWRSRTVLASARERLLYSGLVARAPAIAGALEDSRDFSSLSIGTEWTYLQDGDARWHLGAELGDMHGDNVYVRSLDYSAALANIFGRAVNDDLDRRVNTRQFSESAFAAFRPRLLDRLETELGLRMDAQQVSGQSRQTQWSPRLNLRFHLTPHLDAYGSWGKFSQAQRPDEWRLEEGQSSADPAQVVTQGIIGLASIVPDVAQWRIELYQKHWSPVSPYFDNLLDSQNLLANLLPDRLRLAPGSSDAIGAEFSWRHSLRRHLEFWGALTVARVSDSINGARVVRSWDQRWSAKAGFAWTAERFSMLGSLRTHAGWPKTPVISPTQAQPGDGSLQVRSRNTGNWNSFVSADLRATWAQPLASGSLEFWAELSNAGNRDNKCCLRLGTALAGSTMPANTVSWQPRSIDLGVSWRIR
jgi:TonB dependent receptor/TonB-dependent Receptor Plug Domain